MNRPTIYDVAAAAGVSKSLVSLVIRGAGGVSAASRAAVDRAIEELGYRPNRAAADLAATRTMLVAVLIDDYSNPWFVDLVRGVAHVLRPVGYRLTVVETSTTAPAQDPVDDILSMRADGIVVARDVPDVLIARDTPPLVVAGTREHAVATVDVVANDDERGGALAAEHLLGLGHRRVAHIGAGGGAAAARRRGFVATLDAAGAVCVLSDYTGPATETAGYETAIHLLSQHDGVTAAFAANDVMAIGVLGAARELGLRVPADLSVMGYDDTFLAGTRLIALTTIDDNGYRVGREAAELLITRIENATAPAVHRILEPALVARASTGTAPL